MDNADRLFALYAAHLSAALQNRVAQGGAAFRDCDCADLQRWAMARAKEALAMFEGEQESEVGDG